MSTESVNVWRINTKSRIVESFGGKCGICGYNKCNASLALHHINPNEKEFSFSKVRANPKSWSKIVSELRKCVMLCHNCHSEIHAGVTTLPNNIIKFDEKYTNYKENYTNVHPCPICTINTPDWKTTCSSRCSAKYSHRNRVKWDSIDLNKLLETNTPNDLSVKYNCSTATIYKRINKMGISTNKQVTCNTILDSVDLVSELSKYTYNELALKYNLTTQQLKQYVKRNRIDINKCLNNRNKKYIIPIDSLRNKLSNNSISEIVTEFNVSDTTLHDIRKNDFDSIYPIYGWSSKLAQLWNMSSQAASRYCHKHFGIGNEHNRISKEDIINGFANNLTLKQIGMQFGLSGSSVSEYCKKYGINMPIHVFKVDWNSIDLGEMIKTKTISQISRELGITYTPVRNRAKKLGFLT